MVLSRASSFFRRGSERIRIRAGYVRDRLPGASLQNGVLWNKRQENLPDSVIVCGSGPGLEREFEDARAHLRSAAVIAVNQAAELIPCNFLVTQHPEKAAAFRRASRRRDISVHTGKFRWLADQPGIDVYWPRCAQNVTSGGSAMHIAYMMGFERIVLCGLPLTGGDGYCASLSSDGDGKRFGFESSTSDYVARYRTAFIEFVERSPGLRAATRSYSGLTAELLGRPEWLDG